MKANSFLLFFLYLLFTVSCTENEVEPSFSIGTTEDIEIAPEAGGQTQISFTSSREWQASTTADWITISPMSGNAGAVSITVTANSLNDNDYTRTATLTLTSGTLRKNITLKQEPIIQLEKTAYSVAAAGEVLEIRFSTSIAQDELLIGASKGADEWLTQQPDTRASSYILPYALYLKPCKVSGIGEIIEPVDIKYEKEFICIYPNVMTSTKMIFENCNNISKPLNLDIVINNINKGNLEVLENDLQDITMSLYKEISHLIKDLSINNIVLMSGSGSSILVFAKDVDYEYEKCKEKYPNYWIKKVKIIEE